jgi:hypothetical protein
MSMLSDYEPDLDSIMLKGKPLYLRGLSLDDLAELIRHHLAAARIVFGAFAGAIDGEFLAGALTESPLMCAHAIALSADDAKAVKNALRMPFPLQIEALKKISRLTFDAVGGPGNAFAALATLLRREEPNGQGDLLRAAE